MNTLHWVYFSRSANVSSIKVIWPDGKISQLSNPKADQLVLIDYKNAKPIDIEKKQIDAPQMIDITNKHHIHYRHQENEFDDYKLQELLPSVTKTFSKQMKEGIILDNQHNFKST